MDGYGVDAPSSERQSAGCKYGVNDLMRLRYVDEQYMREKWASILDGLGPIALELDSISKGHQMNGKHKKNNAKNNAVFEKPELDEFYEDPEEVEEVEYYTDSSDDTGLRKPALYVDGEPDFESGSPQDGFEYLRRVRWEEARCEPVKVVRPSADIISSNVQTEYVPKISPIAVCNPELLPSKDWEAEFISDFSQLRMRIMKTPLAGSSSESTLPHFRDKDAWKAFCFGISEEDGTTSNSQCLRLPYLSILLNLDELSRAALFCYHISWLQEVETVKEDRMVWLYALAAVVDEPLDSDMCAVVRELLRKCCQLRADKKFNDQRELHMLNIIITIAGKYFGQADS